MDEDSWGRAACQELGGDEVGIAQEGVVTRLEEEDKGVCVVRISGGGEGVEPTHHPGAE